MGKKKTRAEAAERGTAADPANAAREIRRKAQDQARGSKKLVGVMPEAMADEVTAASGTYPFTFKSAFIIAAAALLGTILIPFLATQSGGTIQFATTAATPPLVAIALAFTRYFVDSERGLARGFFTTLGVAFAVLLAICWLLFYKGILI